MTRITQTTGDLMIAQIAELQERLRDYEFPELIVEEVTDDGETFEAVRCPRCGSLVDGEDLYAVDNCERWNPAGDIYDAINERRVKFESGDRGDFDATLYYMHNDHAVRLPDGWEEDWR